MTFIKKYLRKLNNIQRIKYEEKSKILTFKMAFLVKKFIIVIIKEFALLHLPLEETRDLGMEHVDTIDFMLKSTFCQLSIDGPLTVH